MLRWLLVWAKRGLAMDLKKLPPSMLVVLGLSGEACTTTQACLSPPYEPDETGTSTSSDSATGVGTTAVGESEVGPCLGAMEETGFDTGVATTTTTATGTGTGSDTGMATFGTGSGTDGDTGTTGSGEEGGSTVGPCLAPPGIEVEPTPDEVAATDAPVAEADSRREALRRVLGREALPADVAARLRHTLDDE